MAPFDSYMASFKERVVEAPVKSAGIAVVAGFGLSRIPIFSVIFVVARILIASIRPALLVLGAAKAWDLYQTQKARAFAESPNGQSQDSDSSHDASGNFAVSEAGA